MTLINVGALVACVLQKVCTYQADAVEQKSAHLCFLKYVGLFIFKSQAVSMVNASILEEAH
jgi:hypothetical protein